MKFVAKILLLLLILELVFCANHTFKLTQEDDGEEGGADDGADEDGDDAEEEELKLVEAKVGDTFYFDLP